MPGFTLRSPAKLNLYLKVINKRKDGYHNIVTLFERINLWDDIQLSTAKTNEIHIECDHPHVPLGPENLVHKAAKMLQEDLGLKKGVKIKIKKRIPVAAGLGGGSSNAATVLLGLNRLWHLHLSHSQLLSYARKIGSDVAFFMHNCSWALGTERGDKIKKINIKTRLWHILVAPDIALRSKDVYGALKQHTNLLTNLNANVNILIAHLKKNNIEALGFLISNDLEKAVFDLCPSLKKLKEELKSLKIQGVMTSGSGPAVFGLTASKKKAEKTASLLERGYGRVFVIRTF